MKLMMRFTNGVLKILLHTKRELRMLRSSSGAESRPLYAFLLLLTDSLRRRHGLLI